MAETGDLQPDGRREPILLAVLSLLAVVAFLAVTGISRTYQAQRESLGNRWAMRGMADLNAQRFDRAVGEFRAALLYSRDNYAYQLDLAEALLRLKRTPEAYAYLINLWDRQPEDGLVNLELARVAVQRVQTEQALRYYHNAIYATWPDDQEVRRKDTRLELINYLLSINAKTQAESELIALEANLQEEPSEQAHVGDLFMRTQDYERALAAYRSALRADRHNQAAMSGAGLAAFELGQYPLAQRYLQAAIVADTSDSRSTDLLKTVEMTLQMDPFQRRISASQRDRIVIKSFAAAGQRLKSCGIAPAPAKPSTASPGLTGSWAKLQPRVTEQSLRRDPDLVETAMELVFNIERQTSTTCGNPTGEDLALLLIAKLHEGN